MDLSINMAVDNGSVNQHGSLQWICQSTQQFTTDLSINMTVYNGSVNQYDRQTTMDLSINMAVYNGSVNQHSSLQRICQSTWQSTMDL